MVSLSDLIAAGVPVCLQYERGTRAGEIRVVIVLGVMEKVPTEGRRKKADLDRTGEIALLVFDPKASRRPPLLVSTYYVSEIGGWFPLPEDNFYLAERIRQDLQRAARAAAYQTITPPGGFVYLWHVLDGGKPPMLSVPAMQSPLTTLEIAALLEYSAG